MPPLSRDTRPFWQTRDGRTARLWKGSALRILPFLPERSVHCIITSPPYWGLRAYEVCHCVKEKVARPGCETCGGTGVVPGMDGQIGQEERPDCLGWATGAECGECFVCHLVAVCRGLRRVLRDDGTLWLNLGDSYTPSGNLVGTPWRVALALQADGWVLRQDVIWYKPSPMPESVRNRCTKAHEYVFLLTKGPGYYYDAEAIKERSLEPGRVVKTGPKSLSRYSGGDSGNAAPGIESIINPASSNKRSVWTVSSTSYSGAHFAVYPPRLIEPMIKAGTSERGCCPDCGTSWERVVEQKKLTRERPNDYVKRTGEDGTGNSCPNSVAGVETRTVGWRPNCECRGRLEEYEDVKLVAIGSGPPESEKKQNTPGMEAMSPASTLYGPGEPPAARVEGFREMKVRRVRYVSDLPLDEHPTVPCVVFDPFLGSGTTIATAIELGRAGWGVDLSAAYLTNNAIPRIEGVLLGIPALAPLVGREVRVVGAGDSLPLS